MDFHFELIIGAHNFMILYKCKLKLRKKKPTNFPRNMNTSKSKINVKIKLSTHKDVCQVVTINSCDLFFIVACANYFLLYFHQTCIDNQNIL